MYSVCIVFLLQSVIAKGLLNSLQEQGGLVPVIINFSAQTSSGRTQEIIEGKLEKKRKTILGEITLQDDTTARIRMLSNYSCSLYDICNAFGRHVYT